MDGDQSDLELWDAVKGGDALAFSELYRRHADAIYRFCFKSTASRADAEEITSEVFLDAWRKRKSVWIDTTQSLRPWLFGVAANRIRNQRRLLARRSGVLNRQPKERPVPDFAGDVAGRLDDERQMAEVLEALSALSEIDRQILQLCVWEELSTEQVGQILNLSTPAVRTRLSRAKSHLRANLSEVEEGEVRL